MKTYTRALIVAAGLSAFVGGALAATADPASTGPAPAFTGQPRHERLLGAGWFAGRGMLQALRQLNLNDAQRQSVHAILSAARRQARAAMDANRVARTVLANPGDPNYAAAVQNLQTVVAQRIAQASEMQVQIYNVLTPQQQAQLPQVLASFAAQAVQHRADWLEQHGGAVPN